MLDEARDGDDVGLYVAHADSTRGGARRRGGGRRLRAAERAPLDAVREQLGPERVRAAHGAVGQLDARRGRPLGAPRPPAPARARPRGALRRDWPDSRRARRARGVAREARPLRLDERRAARPRAALLVALRHQRARREGPVALRLVRGSPVTAPYGRALVTGASSGLGRALALWFARRGVVVHAAARREAQLTSLRAEAPGHIEPLVLDVADADAAHARIEALDRETGGFDLVVANAGVGDELPAKALSWERVRKVLDVNVMGATATLCAVVPGMLARGRGHLVGVSSLAAFVSLPKVGAYNASKSYLTAWLESVRLD
ncbi:MAG: SDR family NAD(P)-dependent oxidoreductase, partial [Myxococcaceae bacterium]|nr:SDR family NAD(P)-dependent oxidoreductase [Myxococcaceae bacterium]